MTTTQHEHLLSHLVTAQSNLWHVTNILNVTDNPAMADRVRAIHLALAELHTEAALTLEPTAR